MKLNRKKLYWGTGLAILFLGGLTTYCVIYINVAINEARIIEKAINNPQNVEPGKLLRAINKSFKDLPKVQQQKILKDPEKLKVAVAAAIYQNMDRSFRLLFKLPKPIRTKIITDSAAKLRSKANRKRRIDSFIASDGGNAALQGAARYFWLGLSGKEKAELTPLIEAVQDIIKENMKRSEQR